MTMNPTLDERHMGDSVSDLMRLRGTPKSKSVSQCSEVGARLRNVASDHGLTLDYDQSNSTHILGLRYTEIFASLGGVLVGPKDLDKSMNMLAHAILNDKLTPDGQVLCNANFISSMGDKYVLVDFEYDYPEKVIILPGSNLLETCVDKVALNRAFDQGAWVKPHPLTNRAHRELFKREYGARLLPPNYSGATVVKNSKVIYTSGSSELTLMAVLLGKEVIEIGQGDPLGGYLTIWKFLSLFYNKRFYLNKLLNSTASGIFFPHSTDEEFDEYFKIYKKVCLT
jgi:hypothetical protein